MLLVCETVNNKLQCATCECLWNTTCNVRRIWPRFQFSSDWFVLHRVCTCSFTLRFVTLEDCFLCSLPRVKHGGQLRSRLIFALDCIQTRKLRDRSPGLYHLIMTLVDFRLFLCRKGNTWHKRNTKGEFKKFFIHVSIWLTSNKIRNRLFK